MKTRRSPSVCNTRRLISAIRSFEPGGGRSLQNFLHSSSGARSAKQDDGMTKGPGFTDADFQTNRAWIRQQIKREFYITGFSYEQSQRVALEQDPEVAHAEESMPKAVALFQAAQKLIVERTNQQKGILR